ncbi:MAG TPA: ribosome maturation factor RimM [Gemmatimonadaceae bacterium]|nr:ribosome maturation factor RimM [Gemmatimonadaceae bacterium]
MPAPDFFIVGRVRKAHGLTGELVVEAITDAPDAIFASGRRVFAGTHDGNLAADRQELHITGARPFKGGYLVIVQEITDRTAAEAWRGRYLLLPGSEVTGLAEGEVYLHDLPGLRVELPAGELLGTVLDVYELPQGVVLDVKREQGSVMIPFRDEVVVRVDIAAGLLVVDPPAGLLD